MKNRTKIVTNKMLMTLAIASFIVATVEGVLYYADRDAFFRVLLIIQNSINAFAFKPSVSLNDAIKLMKDHPEPIYIITGYAYGVAVFTAPYCTIAVLYRFLERILRLVFSARRRKNAGDIIIFGYNNDVKMLLGSYAPEKSESKNVHIMTAAEIESEERYMLAKKGYRIHSFDMSAADKDDMDYLLRRTHVFNDDNELNIILFEDTSIKNFSLLRMFSRYEGDGGSELKKGTKITCRCEDAGIAELISDYYNSPAGGTGKCVYDLEVVSLPELQVRRMFEQTPLHSYYNDEKLSDRRVKLLIIGFGSLGQQVLLQAINLSAVHPDNPVEIEIYDRDVERRAEIFTNRFSQAVFDTENGSMRLKDDIADGSLSISFRNMNVEFRRFADAVIDSNRLSPFTYAVIAIDDIDVGVSCAMRLKTVFGEDKVHNTPIIMRLESDKSLAGYIENNDSTFGSVRVIADRQSVLSIDKILNREINEKARTFNYWYNGLTVELDPASKPESGSGQEREIDHKKAAFGKWNAATAYEKSSSKALAAHQPVKDMICRQLAKELDIADIGKKLEELIGADGSLMRYKNGLWQQRDMTDVFLEKLINDPFAYTLAAVEHRRWCYFMISSGWKYGKNKDKPNKIHNCLLTEEALIADDNTKNTCGYDLMPLMMKYKKQEEKKDEQ